jgi:hypothetical protein
MKHKTAVVYRVPGSWTRLLLLLAAWGLGACSSNSFWADSDDADLRSSKDADSKDHRDALPPDSGRLLDLPVHDVGNIYQHDVAALPDGCVSSACTKVVPSGCQAKEICDNGLDDDCNGLADDTCACVPGQVEPCFVGEPGRVKVGPCQMGTQTCMGTQEFGYWGTCENGTWPIAEVCDHLDNDCNGCADDGLCCAGEITCPDPSQIPEGQPFAPYPLDGTKWYSGAASAWSWKIEGGPCDAVLGNSFTVDNPTTAKPTIHFNLSGDYPVTMTVQTPDGPKSCSFIIHVTGPGLRVELCWEGTGFRDIDLHLLREDFGAKWCEPTHDCYFKTCKATSPWAMKSWGYAQGPLALCHGSPEGTPLLGGCFLWPDFWECRGSCANPRLDIDNIAFVGIPENINVDTPTDGQRFRVMVHYYNGAGEAHPMVNIYCNGHRMATYGQAPDQVNGFDNATGNIGECMSNSWRVADVTTHVSGGVTSCTVDAIHPPQQTTGYHVRVNSAEYN